MKDDLQPEEDVVLYYLKNFIRDLGDEDLLLFLRFMTGQDLMPQQPISVMFSRMEGVARRPIAHTCSNLLELSFCYETIQDFSREFKAVLRSCQLYNGHYLNVLYPDFPHRTFKLTCLSKK